jgi:hypothetical protein
MNHINDFVLDADAQERVTKAKAYLGSSAQKSYQSQRILNEKDDVILNLISGIKKMRSDRGALVGKILSER